MMVVCLLFVVWGFGGNFCVDHRRLNSEIRIVQSLSYRNYADSPRRWSVWCDKDGDGDHVEPF